MTGTADPVGDGFVASLARPGGNITGMSLQMVELPGKRLEILKETVPQRTRVAVLANPTFAVNTLYLRNLTVAAHALGLHLHVVEVPRAHELDAAFAAITRTGADALMVLSDPALMDNLAGRVADLAATHRLPAMYNWKMYVDAGGLMSYGPSLLTAFGAPPPTWTRSSKVPNRPTSPWSSPPSSSWSSISRPPSPWPDDSPVHPLPGR